MDEAAWRAELKTYRSPKRTADEVLEGIADHLDTKCTSGHENTVVTSGAQPRAPFKQEATVCDRGSLGCNLQHNDIQALRFTRIGLERLVEQLSKGGK